MYRDHGDGSSPPMVSTTKSVASVSLMIVPHHRYGAPTRRRAETSAPRPCAGRALIRASRRRARAAPSSSSSAPGRPSAWPPRRAAPSCGRAGPSGPTAARPDVPMRDPRARVATSRPPRRDVRAPCSPSAPRSPRRRLRATLLLQRLLDVLVLPCPLAALLDASWGHVRSSSSRRGLPVPGERGEETSSDRSRSRSVVALLVAGLPASRAIAPCARVSRAPTGRARRRSSGSGSRAGPRPRFSRSRGSCQPPSSVTSIRTRSPTIDALSGHGAAVAAAVLDGVRGRLPHREQDVSRVDGEHVLAARASGDHAREACGATRSRLERQLERPRGRDGRARARGERRRLASARPREAPRGSRPRGARDPGRRAPRPPRAERARRRSSGRRARPGRPCRGPPASRVQLDRRALEREVGVDAEREVASLLERTDVSPEGSITSGRQVPRRDERRGERLRVERQVGDRRERARR